MAHSAFNPYCDWLEIPADELPANHYRLLGVDLWESDANVISAAAERRTAHLRSFQPGPQSSLAQKLKNEVAAAKVCLLSPSKRAAYDATLKARLTGTVRTTAPTARARQSSPTASEPSGTAKPPSATAPPATTPLGAPAKQAAKLSSAAVQPDFGSLAGAISEVQSADRQTATRKRRQKRPVKTGLGTYNIVVLVIGTIALAGILWLRTNHWTIHLVQDDPVPAAKQTDEDQETGRAKQPSEGDLKTKGDAARGPADQEKPAQRMPVGGNAGPTPSGAE